IWLQPGLRTKTGLERCLPLVISKSETGGYLLRRVQATFAVAIAFLLVGLGNAMKGEKQLVCRAMFGTESLYRVNDSLLPGTRLPVVLQQMQRRHFAPTLHPPAQHIGDGTGGATRVLRIQRHNQQMFMTTVDQFIQYLRQCWLAIGHRGTYRHAKALFQSLRLLEADQSNRRIIFPDALVKTRHPAPTELQNELSQ